MQNTENARCRHGALPSLDSQKSSETGDRPIHRLPEVPLERRAIASQDPPKSCLLRTAASRIGPVRHEKPVLFSCNYGAGGCQVRRKPRPVNRLRQTSVINNCRERPECRSVGRVGVANAVSRIRNATEGVPYRIDYAQYYRRRRRQPTRPAPRPPMVSISHVAGSGTAATPPPWGAGIGVAAGL
jgi:hypothetical protein